MAPAGSYGAGAGRAPDNFSVCSQSIGSTSEQTFQDPTIRISQQEYNKFKLISRQYVNLRRNLILGGVDEATLDALSADEESNANADGAPLQPQSGNNEASYSNRNNSYDDSRSHASHGSRYNNENDSNSSRKASTPSASVGDAYVDEGLEDGEVPQGVDAHGHGDNVFDDHESNPNFASKPGSGYGSAPRNGPVESLGLHPVHDRKCLRTLQLVGLPESATLADVAAAVRGGLLLELFLRVHAHERSAFVSFAREPDAKAYFEHVKNFDLYIKGKRVDIRWSEKQHTLLPNIGHKINTVGATRNLVVRQCSPRLTEAQVREDLDHIHNLVVISVTFSDNNCYISTNSVYNALFARSCMMSRLAYRTSRIEWMPDECAQPLERMAPAVRPQRRPKPKPAPQPKASFGVQSRFQLLNMDDNDGDGDSDDNDGTGKDSDDDEDDSGDDDGSSDGVHGGGGVSTKARK